MKRNRTVAIEAVIGVSLVMATTGLSGCGYAQGGGTGVLASTNVKENTSNGDPKSYYLAMTGNDSNSGARTSPWRTIGHAGKVVAAGDTVHVLSGVYHESVSFRILRGAPR